MKPSRWCIAYVAFALGCNAPESVSNESDGGSPRDGATLGDSRDPDDPCGNGELDEGEVCDDGAANSDEWSAGEHCNADCTGSAPYCGDGATAEEEFCDDGEGNSDAWAEENHCNASCTALAPTCDLEEPPPSQAIAGVPYPKENPHSHEKALLGKILFWDQQLSSNDSIACGSCHAPSAGGSDPRNSLLHPGPDGLAETGDDVRGSNGMRRCRISNGNIIYVEDPVFGFGPQVTGRKAPSFLDAMFAPESFWDGRAASVFVDPDTEEVAIASGGALENQALGPFLSDVEMACEERSFADLHQKIAASTPLALASDLPPDMANAICKYPSYGELFEMAFGDAEINSKRIAFAIATYERTLVSGNSPYDRFTREVDPDVNALSDAEKRGLTVFEEAGCGNCHLQASPAPGLPHTFTNNTFHNLGHRDIDNETFPDLGRFDVTGLAADRGKMKTPSLRNVGLREAGGLLHMGNFYDMENVVDFYNITVMQPGPESTVDPRMIPLNLTAEQRADLVAFLRGALNDPDVAAENYPFDRPRLGPPPSP